MKFSKYYILEQSSNSLKEDMLQIIKKNNLWKEASDDAKNTVKENAKKDEKFEGHKNLIESLLNSLKNASDEDFNYFRENENELTEYENLLLEILYKDDNNRRSVLENYFKEIDQIAINRLSSSSQSTSTQPTTPQPTPSQVDQAQPPLDAAGIEELNNIFGRLGFK